jgi:protein tyrosine phosphatase
MTTWFRYHPISQYNDWIWLGGLADLQEHLDLLRTQGVTHILNLAAVHDDADYPAPGFTVEPVVQLDEDAVPPATLEHVCRWLEARERAGERVFIHCAAGISRTPSFLIAYLLWRDGAHCDTDLRTEWSIHLDRISRVRDVVLPHWKLKRSILGYFEGKLPGWRERAA